MLNVSFLLVTSILGIAEVLYRKPSVDSTSFATSCLELQGRNVQASWAVGTSFLNQTFSLNQFLISLTSACISPNRSAHLLTALFQAVTLFNISRLEWMDVIIKNKDSSWISQMYLLLQEKLVPVFSPTAG